MDITEPDALLIIDVQNDFCPGGALPVPDGDAVVRLINVLMPNFEHVFATQDFHPEDHSSFVEQGGPWPPHCVQGTEGAGLHPDLDISGIDRIFQKGTDAATDGYSGFAGTDLANELNRLGVQRVFVAGLATDYCVKATTIEAIDQGYDAVVIIDAIRAVNVKPRDGEDALADMEEAGATLLTSDEINS